MEDVWLKLGRQPVSTEMKRPLSKYTRDQYDRYFGSWTKSLEAFVDFMNSDNTNNTVVNETEINENNPVTSQNISIIKHATKRDPSERLKVQVLMRDGNKCRLCGITVTGDNIHFDHIKPWSKGGETTLENLQVLCSKHNLAKGNLEFDSIKY